MALATLVSDGIARPGHLDLGPLQVDNDNIVCANRHAAPAQRHNTFASAALTCFRFAVIWLVFWGWLATGLISGYGQETTPDKLTAEQVRQAIEKSARFLKRAQRDDGSWAEFPNHPGGTTALMALALLNAGEPVNSNVMQRALRYLEANPTPARRSTYTVALRLMVLALADPSGQKYRRLMEEDVRWLAEIQVDKGGASGGWSYFDLGGSADSSNTQFALLGLHEAARVGIPVPRSVWSSGEAYWQATFRQNVGTFSYNIDGAPSGGSMTCAGISSLLIIDENLLDLNDFIQDGKVVCCRPPRSNPYLEAALKWMGRNFSVVHNPTESNGRGGELFYYLYGMERVGRLTGNRFIGTHDWYRLGANHLINVQQQRDGSWSSAGITSSAEINTAFGLLFLSKGRRPVVFGKYQYAEQDQRWDLHPTGVHYLTRELESAWQMILNWQTVRASSATVNDLNEAPVLFISGQQAIELSDKQKAALKEYVEQGGFIFAEACQGDGCGDATAFDESFRALLKELFPESKLEVLPAEHPIWTANYPLKPNPDWPVLGLQACCRTSVVYCQRNLSCYWELDRPSFKPRLPDKIADDVTFCRQLGINVAAYATGRELLEKLDRPKIDSRDFVALEGRMLVMPKLDHSGGADEAPNAWRNLMQELQRQTDLRLLTEKRIVSPQPGQLNDFPFLFVHGRNRFQWTSEERQALRQHFKTDGFMLADAVCASKEFAESIRREMLAIWPEGKWVNLDSSHPVWTAQFGSDIKQVTLRIPDPAAPRGYREQSGPPIMEGFEIDGRLAVILSPYDLSCALENATGNQCQGYSRADAQRIGINIVLYYLLRDED